MGLFNSGKNDKIEKVNKYERHYNVPRGSSRRHSSQHRSHQGEAAVRAMSQPPLMRAGGGYYQPGGVFVPPVVGPMASNVMPQFRYPISPLDLSKYPSPTAYSPNPFAPGHMGPMSLAPVWNNGMPLANNRSAFQQPLNDFHQGGWPVLSPPSTGFMPPMQF